MNIEFSSSKLKKQCSSQKEMRREWGDKMAKKLMRRFQDMEAAATLEDMRNVPGRCHELTGDRNGGLAMDLVHPQRLVFEPGHDPIPTKPDGGLDWRLVTRITVASIEDYH